jgi:hypothetical protein
MTSEDLNYCDTFSRVLQTKDHPWSKSFDGDTYGKQGKGQGCMYLGQLDRRDHAPVTQHHAP